MSLFIAVLGYLALALVMVMDKYIVTNSVSKPVVYTFYSTIFMFAAIILWPLAGFELLQGIDWWWALVSGLAFGCGLWGLYAAVKMGEASHINPFNGAIVTISVFIGASIFLYEQLTTFQLIGIVILTIAALLLAQETSQKHHGFHKGFIWAVVSGICFGISHVAAKYLYDIYPFWTAFTWTRFTTGFIGLVLLAYPSVRNTFKKKKKKPKSTGRKYALPIIVGDKIFGILGVVLIQYAISVGSVTMVNALVGIQYIFMFFLIYFLTKVHPKVFKEYFTKVELHKQLFALALILIGSAFFVF